MSTTVTRNEFVDRVVGSKNLVEFIDNLRLSHLNRRPKRLFKYLVLFSICYCVITLCLYPVLFSFMTTIMILVIIICVKLGLRDYDFIRKKKYIGSKLQDSSHYLFNPEMTFKYHFTIKGNGETEDFLGRFFSHNVHYSKFKENYHFIDLVSRGYWIKEVLDENPRTVLKQCYVEGEFIFHDSYLFKNLLECKRSLTKNGYGHMLGGKKIVTIDVARIFTSIDDCKLCVDKCRVENRNWDYTVISIGGSTSIKDKTSIIKILSELSKVSFHSRSKIVQYLNEYNRKVLKMCLNIPKMSPRSDERNNRRISDFVSERINHEKVKGEMIEEVVDVFSLNETRKNKKEK